MGKTTSMIPSMGIFIYGVILIASFEYYPTIAYDKDIEIEEVNSSLYYVSIALVLN